MPITCPVPLSWPHLLVWCPHSESTLHRYEVHPYRTLPVGPGPEFKTTLRVSSLGGGWHAGGGWRTGGAGGEAAIAVWGQDEILERLRGRDGAGPLSLPLCLLPGSEPWLSCDQWPPHHSPPSSCGPRGQLLPVTISGHHQQCESGLEHTEPCHLEPVGSSLLAHCSQSSSSETILFPTAWEEGDYA